MVVFIPEVLLLPLKINIDGIIIMNSVTPRLYFMVFRFFRLLRFFFIKRKRNSVIDAIKVLIPANKTGGIIFVE